MTGLFGLWDKLTINAMQSMCEPSVHAYLCTIVSCYVCMKEYERERWKICITMGMSEKSLTFVCVFSV